MSAAERLHYSLSARVFHAVIICAVVLGAVLLVVGLSLYSVALSNQYINESFNTSRSAAVIVEAVVDVEPLTRETLRIYHGMSEEERETVGTDEYYARFAAVEDSEQQDLLVSVLKAFLTASEMDDVYCAMYDRETSAIVYIADPDDTDLSCPLGEWEPATKKELRTFLDWDGTGRPFYIGHTEKYGWLCTSVVPLKNAAGETVGFILADVTLGGVAAGIRNYALQYFLAILAVMLLLAFLLTRHMKKTIVVPINSIAEAAQNYVNDRRQGAEESDHFARLNIRTGDEIENLALVMADMERDLGEIESNLTAVTAEKERIGTELNLATRIQAHMLPSIFPAFPDRSEFDIYATMIPAKEVGGDFYDFFLVDDDHLGLVMADVSGKGVPAALFMMATKILLQNFAMTGRSPAQVLETVNRQICSNNHEEMFVTVWLGILELSTGTLTAANAGHEFPALKKPGGPFELVHDKHGFVLGGMDGVRYTEYTLRLEPGTKLFVYTDGVPEATDLSETLFGTDRMLASLNRAADDAPEKILSTVRADVAAFAGEAPQFDDLTMLCLEYFGNNTQNKNEKGGDTVKELTIEATVENIAPVTDFINAELEALDCPIKVQTQIDIAVDELFGNIAHYAYNPAVGPATVRVEVEDDPMAVLITFIDHGKPYDPLAADDPDVTLSAEDRKIGGLGVFLVKKTMDDVSYEYQNGQNILRIKKHI
ncbi:MAG: SpoIIE family protein phosphatase [Oscillibacter sp.]|nr:SpoIIE family protein phosphatase [Oscillibacter sp.]